jgi:two-component system sensor histidine kinase and response regulator WspE
LIVDHFRGEQDLVVRRLDDRLGTIPDISAAAILEDGSPVLIVDVDDLRRSIEKLIQGETLYRVGQECPQFVQRRKRILVVDDSVTVREVQRQLLTTAGYEVELAIDGADGWNVLSRKQFDLIISDIDMPRMTGLELLRLIKADEQLASIPTIIVSYKDREEHRTAGLKAGADYYLTKSSFHDDTFIHTVVNLIGEAV